MNNLIIGNIIALIGSLLMVYVGFLKNKKKILFWQTIQISLFVVSNLVLGGISGAITNTLSCIRNILCYKDKLKIKEMIVITIVAVILILKFNNLGLIGLLPLISTVVYLWFMNTKNIISFKILIITTMLLWLIYDISIKSYVSAIFDFANIMANCISILQLKDNTKHIKSQIQVTQSI